MAGPELLPEGWRLCFHSVRAATFHNWPLTEGCACTPERMAAAGFVHTPSENSPDVAQCFVELEGWEPDDDPLEEHKKYSAACGFLSLQKEPSNLTALEFLELEKTRTRNALKKEVSQKMTEFEDKAKIQRCRIKNLA
ncbi:baculoviral IAP repeat-containing protein 5-like [Melospiza georgiana]|uniref:baculoviral IAP repeat-containing protein 5-like n=1 Tax=Melospiza georgiana TaxID=44398 RepID=UPI0025AC32D5|nr:baculoviral IAP repeat-containing protein 5-like [Melospiza georgiana]